MPDVMTTRELNALKQRMHAAEERLAALEGKTTTTPRAKAKKEESPLPSASPVDAKSWS